MATSEEWLRLIAARIHHPASIPEIARRLGVPREERAAFRRHVRALVAAGDLIRVRGNRVGLPGRMDLVVGRLTRAAAGFGFVVPEDGDAGERDVFVAPPAMGDAMHGDRVVVRVERHTERGPDGRIVQILERAHDTIVGRFERTGRGLGYVVPFDPKVGMDVQVPEGQASTAEPGEMVVVLVTAWPTASRGPVGRVVEVIGQVGEAGVDTQVIIRKYRLPDAHPDAAVAQAQHLGSGVAPADLAGRTDFRAWSIVTIDGEHARDFDDAISLERLPNGHYWLGVHIADVSHYVQEGTPLDDEARLRGTSVYFPERAVHMFPSELSTGLCSLNPHVDRLVQSCLMEVDPRGAVVRYEIHDGVIHSRARMTYTDVNAIVADRNPVLRERYAPLVPLFDLMHELFEVLQSRRHRRGSIDFDLPETEVVLSEYGDIEAIVASERNVAHRLIEEFMLLANETVAGHVVAHDIPSLHRVHEAPDLKKVEEFADFIEPFGYGLGATGHAVTPKDFQRLIERIQGTPEERPIAALMLRTMQKARYDPVSLGHFGLATEHYLHFTSPIRRYPDLVAHRLLREGRHGRLTAAQREELADELPDVARHSSEMERRADDAERELLQWKKVRFMESRVGDEYEGYVTGVAPFGLFIQLVEHFVEGLVPVSTMADDYYRFLEQQHMLKGEHTKKIYRLGDKVQVQVVRVDMTRRQVELALTDVLKNVRQQETGRPARSRVRSKVERKRATRPGRRERAARRSTKRR